MRKDNELYRRLRALPCDELWNGAVARFDRAPAEERPAQAAVIRAVGVVFSASGSAAQRAEARAWLSRLLRDPAEKVRRYAIAALPKLGAGPGGEEELLALLRTTTLEREKKALREALEKIGGTITLQAVAAAPEALAPAEQKVRAKVARTERPSAIRMDRVCSPPGDVRMHLRCRKGLETIVRQEVDEAAAHGGKFRVLEEQRGLVAIAPAAPFSLRDLYTLRCFGTAGFVLAVVPGPDPAANVEAFAAAIASPLARLAMAALTEGSLRYRLQFFGEGRYRALVRPIADLAYARCPDILNDAREAPWAVDIHPFGEGSSVELRPRLSPDPRLSYRQDDVDAASHPPLAACMARLAGRAEGEIVWDPFCGSGLELIECALLGGVHALHGTDVSPHAVAIARTNITAAKLNVAEAHVVCADFRDAAVHGGPAPGSVSLIVTNPPMGRRIRVPDLRGLIDALFRVAAGTLKPGGRLVFANPTHSAPHDPALKLRYRREIDLGGFDCRLEMYLKLAR